MSLDDDIDFILNAKRLSTTRNKFHFSIYWLSISLKCYGYGAPTNSSESFRTSLLKYNIVVGNKHMKIMLIMNFGFDCRQHSTLNRNIKKKMFFEVGNTTKIGVKVEK
jgi:hypothetical protein